jgi:flagellar basal-body rod protein FlgB
MAETNKITDFLQAALKAENLRQKTIANNIANLQTPGYRSVDVKFEQLLEKALKDVGNFDLRKVAPEIFETKQTPVKSNGNDVNLEVEIGRMVKNSVKHTAYVRLLARIYQQMEHAINVT